MTQSSFLPEDYIAQRAERRTNIISLTLFCVVMTLVLAAFLVTNRKWSNIRADQETINAEYQLVAVKIKELTELEQQKDQMLNKAELAASLVERVPRSILLAEIINRMPPRLSLLNFTLKSEKIVRPTASVVNAGQAGRGPRRGVTMEQARQKQAEIETPRYKSEVSMIGVAPTDLEVSKFLYALNNHSLLREVNLIYSQEKEIDSVMMRQFRIKMMLDPNADVRDIQPLIMPRDIKNPMTGELQIGLNHSPSTTIAVPLSSNHEGD